jgi:hypothetical protein
MHLRHTRAQTLEEKFVNDGKLMAASDLVFSVGDESNRPVAGKYSVFLPTYTCMCLFRACMHACVCMYVYIYIYIHTYTHTYIYTYVYIYIYIYTHTQIDKNTHSLSYMSNLRVFSFSLVYLAAFSFFSRWLRLLYGYVHICKYMQICVCIPHGHGHGHG